VNVGDSKFGHKTMGCWLRGEPLKELVSCEAFRTQDMFRQ
jgi:hypothetical protein